MPLDLTNWDTISADARLRRCSALTTVIPLGASAPTPVLVTFSIRCGPFQRGESAALPPAEASALISAGFAS